MTAHNQAENKYVKYVIFGLFGPPYKVTSLEPEKHLILNCNKEKYCLFCIKWPCLKINFDKYTCSLEYKTIATTMSRIKINKWVKREKLTRGGISTIRYMTLQAVIGSYRVAEKKDCPFKTATLCSHTGRVLNPESLHTLLLRIKRKKFSRIAKWSRNLLEHGRWFPATILTTTWKQSVRTSVVGAKFRGGETF